MLRNCLGIRRKAVIFGEAALRSCRSPSERQPNRACLQPRKYHGASGTDMVKQNGSQQFEGMTVVDLRSDTVTRPTAAMLRAMVEAPLGDDVLGDDPTVQALEAKVAEGLGFEAALFVPTGTMANLIAVMVHCTGRDSEILLGDKSHIHLYEQGGCASIAGVHPRALPNNADGTIDLSLLSSKIRTNDVHFPVTRLICLENTHNYRGGKVLPLDYLDQVVALSKEVGIPLHMDGARLANASAAIGVPMSRILRGFASSTLCLSKSLGAPIGSVLVGSTQFIKQARRTRKVLGGGMRQVGVIAAAGIVAVETMCDRLVDDFRHAKILAEAVNSCCHPGVTVDLANLHTNILLVDLDPAVIQPDQFCQRMETAPVEEVAALGEAVAARMFPMSDTNVRMVLHCDVSPEDVEKVAMKLKYVVANLKHPSEGANKRGKLQRINTLVVE